MPGGGPREQAGGDVDVRLIRRVDAERPGQPGHGLRTGELLEAAAVGLRDLAYEGRAGHRKEAELACAAGEAPVQPAADDEALVGVVAAAVEAPADLYRQ